MRGKVSGKRLGWAFKVKVNDFIVNLMGSAGNNTSSEVTETKGQTGKVCLMGKLQWKIKNERKKMGKRGQKNAVTEKQGVTWWGVTSLEILNRRNQGLDADLSCFVIPKMRRNHLWLQI